jgi:O-antigen/teichoic acid export membrane protein
MSARWLKLRPTSLVAPVEPDARGGTKDDGVAVSTASTGAHPGRGERRRLLTATYGVTAGMLLSAAGAGAVAIVSSRALGPSGRGVLALAVALSTFTAVLSNNGLTIGGRRLLADVSEPITTRDYLAAALRRSWLVAVLQIVAAVALMPAAHARLSTSGVVLMVLYGLAFFGAQVTRDGLYGLGRGLAASWLNATGNVVALVAAGIAILLHAGNVVWYLAAILIGATAELALGLWSLHDRSDASPTSATSLARLRAEGRRGATYVLAQALLLRADRYILGLMGGTREVGLYAAAATVTEAIGLLPLAASQMLFRPLVEGSLRTSDFARSRRVVLTATCVMSGVFAIIAPQVVVGVLGGDFGPAVPALRTMLIGVVLLASFQIDSLALVAVGRYTGANVAVLTGLVLMVTADVALIPAFGAEGAAIATVAAYGIAAGIAWYLRRVDVPTVRPRFRSCDGL